MTVNVQQLLTMPQEQLDQIFGAGQSGTVPDGPAKGTVILPTGTQFTQEIAEFMSLFVWHGKTFDSKRGFLTNQILPFGLNAIIGEIYKGPSLLDQKECIILDYSKTSLVAHWMRDEIRQVEPKLYLGQAYWDAKRLLSFALEFGG